MKALLLTLLLPAAAFAQDDTRLTPDEFEAYVTGKTLLYGSRGQEYGGEDYLGDRKVRWSYLDGRCKNGYWYDTEGDVCFVYEDSPDPQCWSFFFGASGLIARFENSPAGTELYETGESDQPLLCLGPEVGV